MSFTRGEEHVFVTEVTRGPCPSRSLCTVLWPAIAAEEVSVQYAQLPDPSDFHPSEIDVIIRCPWLCSGRLSRGAPQTPLVDVFMSDVTGEALQDD